jgi:hypothetical protein
VAKAQQRLNEALTPVAAPAIAKAPDHNRVNSETKTNKLVSVRISESDVNTVLAGSSQVIADLESHDVSYVQVKFIKPNIVLVSGQLSRNGSNQSITVSGILNAASDGELAYHPQSVKLGALPVPESTFDKLIQRESTRILNASLPHIPFIVTGISIKNHQLLLTGTPRPG